MSRNEEKLAILEIAERFPNDEVAAQWLIERQWKRWRSLPGLRKQENPRQIHQQGQAKLLVRCLP